MSYVVHAQSATELLEDNISAIALETLSLSYQIIKITMKGFALLAIPFWISVIGVIGSL